MQDEKDKTLLGEEKDPFASIIDEQVDPFESKETDPFEKPLKKQEKVEIPKKEKRDLPKEDNNDYFNPISTKEEDQIYEVEPISKNEYRETRGKTSVMSFVIFCIVVLITISIQWIINMLL